MIRPVPLLACLALPSLWAVSCVQEPPPPVLDAAPRVEVVEVAPAPTTLSRTLLATVQAEHDAQLSVLRSGRVIERVAEPGTLVQAGQVLLRLDSREAKAQRDAARAGVQRARIALEAAGTNLERLQALGGGVSAAELGSARLVRSQSDAALAGARAELEMARIHLDYHSLRAPFDGELAALSPDLGEAVSPGIPVARVVDASSTRLEVGLLEDEVLPALAQAATFQVKAGGKSVTAELVHVSPAADPITGDWRAELRLDGSPFHPGTPAQVELVLPTVADAGLLPPEAVTDGAVWSIREDTAHRTPVDVVAEHRSGLLVRGVPVGSRVVLHAAEPLQGGERVVTLESP